MWSVPLAAKVLMPTMIRVGLDTRIFGSPVMSGTERSVTLFKQNLWRFGPRYRFSFFGDSPAMVSALQKAAALKARLPEASQRRSINHLILRDQFMLPELLAKRKIELFHSFALPIPCSATPGCRFVVTVHDIIPWLGVDKDCFTSEFNAYYRHWMERSLRKADRILAISGSTKRDICGRFGIPPSKVTVTYCAPSDYFRPLSAMGAVRNQLRRSLGINGEFILTVGVLTPRKNVETLMRAYASLRSRRKLRHALVVAGSTAFYQPRLPKTQGIIFTGPVSDGTLRQLYNAAALFVFPSLYEGFGYPVVEAMACGTPVIAARSSSLPELVGPAGLTFEPRDDAALAGCIRSVLDDPRRRDQLVKNGFQRARAFSWPRYIRSIEQVYGEMSGVPALGRKQERQG